MRLSFGSACHGAGRSMSRTQATKKWRGREVVDELARRGILIRSPSFRGVAEEAPGAYKDVRDRKSTRLNSSHLVISYAVFCLKKKKKKRVDVQSLYDIASLPGDVVSRVS